jgi:hypothetical protein
MDRRLFSGPWLAASLPRHWQSKRSRRRGSQDRLSYQRDAVVAGYSRRHLCLVAPYYPPVIIEPYYAEPFEPYFFSPAYCVGCWYGWYGGRYGYHRGYGWYGGRGHGGWGRGSYGSYHGWHGGGWRGGHR